MSGDIFYYFQLLCLLLGILIACQVFTNAIENLGDKLNLNHEFTGSILAAVGTALPETILPLVAIYMASQSSGAEQNDIAIGAIVGAPFMLSTLAMLLLGLSIVLHQKKRQSKFGDKDSKQLQVNHNHLKRDLLYFLIIFSIGISSSLFLGILDGSFDYMFKILAVIAILFTYVIYLMQTYKASAEEIGDEEDDTPELYLKRFLGIENLSLPLISVQALLGLIGIIYFAHDFVHAVEHLAHSFNISPLILSLVISPIVTELPEKVNTWIWSSEGKDTLAIGNLSGAMVFQAAIPCIVGIMLTPWQLDKVVLVSATLTIFATFIILGALNINKKVDYRTLMLAGSLYFVYLYLVLFNFA